MKKLVIADLDGTIAFIQHRLYFIQKEKPDWDMFFKLCVSDAPNTNVIDTLNRLKNSGCTIVILTGRSDMVKKETVEWLKKYKVPYDMLVMRKQYDRTSDTIFKSRELPNILASLSMTTDDILCVLEDRQRVVDMWRKMNIACFQVEKSLD